MTKPMTTQMREAHARRQRILNYIRENAGVTRHEISVAVNISSTPVAKHLVALESLGLIVSHTAPKGSPATVSRREKWAAPGITPKFPSVPAAKVATPKIPKPKPIPASERFIGRRFTKAIQIGIARDWLQAAFFGPAPVWGAA